MDVMTSFRTLTHQGLFTGDDRGFRKVGGNKSDPRYRENFLAALHLVEGAKTTRWGFMRLQEALTTSDFGVYFGDVLYRQILANYDETPYTYNLYAKVGTHTDLTRAKKLFAFDGGAGVLDLVGEVGEYPERKRQVTKYQLQLQKYGDRMPFSWELMLADDLDGLKDTPAFFGRAARRSVEKYVTTLFANNTAFFTAANKNIVTSAVNPVVTALGLTNNPVFSLPALQAAMTILDSQVDVNGEPIAVESYVLVFPPALYGAVRNVLHSTQLMLNDMGGTALGTGTSAFSGERLIMDNWAKEIVIPAKNYYLPIVDTSHGNTGWYVFANPATSRPAIEVDFLQGHEQPEIFQKAPNSLQVGEGRIGGMPAGGALANPMDGDFDTDAIHFKVRHVFGGTMVDPKVAVYSNGSGA